MWLRVDQTRGIPLTLYIVLVLTVPGCLSQNTREKGNGRPGNYKLYETQDQADLKAGETLDLVKINCYACHNPMVMDHDAILAPPLVAVKYRYRNIYPDRDTFMYKMTDFLLAPTEKKALMPRPVAQFGVMPPLGLDSTLLNRIAGYIYDHPLEEPEWFAAHFEQEHKEPWTGEN